MNDEAEVPLTEGQRQSINQDITRNLTDCGVGSSFHKRTLSEVPQGDKLSAWVKDKAKEGIPKGRGITLIGSSLKTRESAILLGRALLLRQFTTHVLSLPRLVKYLEKGGQGGQTWSDIKEAQALVVLGLIQFVGTHDTPLTNWQRMDVEDFLSDRLNRGRAVLPQIESSFAAAKGWYSTAFSEQIADANLELIA
jgi:hypothetical protein